MKIKVETEELIELNDLSEGNDWENLRKFWAKVKRLRSQNADGKVGIQPIENDKGELQTELDSILNAMKDYFKDLLDGVEIDDFINNFGPDDPIPPVANGAGISKEEVIRAISRMKSGKASGIDDITPEMLKALDDAGVEVIHELIHKAWTEKVVPEDWSTAIIAPLYKNKGEKTKCQNYRGISLLSVVGKLYAIILEQKLREKIGGKISKLQFGFQPRKGTRDCIFVLIN